MAEQEAIDQLDDAREFQDWLLKQPHDLSEITKQRGRDLGREFRRLHCEKLVEELFR